MRLMVALGITILGIVLFSCNGNTQYNNQKDTITQQYLKTDTTVYQEGIIFEVCNSEQEFGTRLPYGTLVIDYQRLIIYKTQDSITQDTDNLTTIHKKQISAEEAIKIINK